MTKNQSRRAAPHDLQFNVAQLLKEVTGATRLYEVRTQALDKLDEEVRVVSPVVGQVRFLYTGSDILVTGQLQVTVEKSCGRCLERFTAPLAIELEEEFYPAIDILTGAVLPLPDDAEETNRIDEHHILDLQEVVRQEFLLASDARLYCRPDCAGICPHCGQDLNAAGCDCQQTNIDPRWAGLQALQEE